MTTQAAVAVGGGGGGGRRKRCVRERAITTNRPLRRCIRSHSPSQWPRSAADKSLYCPRSTQLTHQGGPPGMQPAPVHCRRPRRSACVLRRRGGGAAAASRWLCLPPPATREVEAEEGYSLGAVHQIHRLLWSVVLLFAPGGGRQPETTCDDSRVYFSSDEILCCEHLCIARWRMSVWPLGREEGKRFNSEWLRLME